MYLMRRTKLSERVSTTYQRLPQDVKPGDRILLDDDGMDVRVLSASIASAG